MMAAIRPTLQKALINQFSPQALGKRGLNVLTQYLELFADLPKEIRRGIQTFRAGNLRVRIDPSQLENLQRPLTRASNRLAMWAITSALILGISIIVASGKGASLGGGDLYKSFGIGAVIGGVFTLFSIWRDKS